jgi:DNA polymerase zeta
MILSALLLKQKKKYCGMKFESKDQINPVFEAKGLETVRRDQCTLTQKILREALITLFTNGIDAVKSSLLQQYTKVLSGHFPVSDFVLTGRVRSHYRGGRIGPVQATLARRLAENDPSRVVRHGERLAYVIVATPGTTFKLKDCVLTPLELLERWDAYTVHTGYYLTRHVNAALQRCLGLAPHKVDVATWYEECPKPRRRIHYWPVTQSSHNIMISTFFGSDDCSLCGRKCKSGGRTKVAVCGSCRQDMVQSTERSLRHLNRIQRQAHLIATQCSTCNSCFEDANTFAHVMPKNTNHDHKSMAQGQTSMVLATPLANCTCIDCPTLYERHKLRENEIEAMALCEALQSLDVS